MGKSALSHLPHWPVLREEWRLASTLASHQVPAAIDARQVRRSISWALLLSLAFGRCLDPAIAVTEGCCVSLHQHPGALACSHCWVLSSRLNSLYERGLGDRHGSAPSGRIRQVAAIDVGMPVVWNRIQAVVLGSNPWNTAKSRTPSDGCTLSFADGSPGSVKHWLTCKSLLIAPIDTSRNKASRCCRCWLTLAGDLSPAAKAAAT